MGFLNAKTSLLLITCCVIGCASPSMNINELATTSRKAGQAYAEGNCDLAIPYYMQLINELPQDLDTRIKVANCIYLQGDSAGAIKQYKAILRSDSTYSSAWYNLAYVQLEELIESLQEAIDSMSDETEENEMVKEKAVKLLSVYHESVKGSGLVR